MKNIDLGNVKIVIFDLMGVLVKGTESIESEISDVLPSCLELCGVLKKLNNKIAIVSSDERTEYLNKAFSSCDFEIITGSVNKLVNVKQIVEKHGFEMNNVLYVGDEIIDVPVLREAGIGLVPKHVSGEAKRTADFVLNASAGPQVVNSIKMLFEQFN